MSKYRMSISKLIGFFKRKKLASVGGSRTIPFGDETLGGFKRV
jgi:hypothetical protein